MRSILVVGTLLLLTEAGAIIWYRWPSLLAGCPAIYCAELIKGQQWHMAGVTNKDGRLTVVHSGLSLVRQDGSLGQDNPALNLYGLHLESKAAFSLTMQLHDITAMAQINLYGAPPLIQDEWRAESGMLSIMVRGDHVEITLADQRDGSDAAHIQYPITHLSSHMIMIQDIGGRLVVVVDNIRKEPAIADRDIFHEGRIWIGLNAPITDSSFTVSAFQARALAGGTIRTADTSHLSFMSSAHGLATTAQKNRPAFLVGTASALGPMVSDADYRRLLGNFNAVTTENVGKFETIHPLPNMYNFHDMDAMVALARRAGMKVHGHTLVFGEANPPWVQAMATMHPEQLKQLMIDHIHSVVTHYKGQIEGWDVVNEPLADYGTAAGQYGLRQHIWYQSMGPAYIAIALRAAHQADPTTGLWINEFGLETDEARFAQMLVLLKQLKAANAPLTGVGFEAHIDSSDTDATDTQIDTAVLESHIAAVAALGFRTRISELDVTSTREYPVFAQVARVCYQQPACVGVTLWGMTDAFSSSATRDEHGIVTLGIGLPWDSHERALPPVSALTRVFDGR